MPLTVTNLSSHMVVLRLRSGDTLHLAPGRRTDELPDAEIRDNTRVARLVERQLVSVDEVAKPKKPGRSSSTKSDSGTEDAG